MEWTLLLFLSAFVLCFTIVSGESSYSSYQEQVSSESELQDKLKNALLSSFNPSISPSTNESVKVTFGLDLEQIIKMEEQQHTISIVSRMKMEFMDNRLEWDSESFGDISSLRIPFSQLWLPDVTLHNRLSGSQFSSEKLDALVYASGRVLAVAPMQFTAPCEMDLTYFPYDTQKCKLIFGSLSADKSFMELDLWWGDNVGLDNYREHPEWKLQNVSFKLNDKSFKESPGQIYQEATVTLELKRKSTPYAGKLVIPSVLTAFLVVFTFILPSSSGEKIVFCLILLLCLRHLHTSVPTNTETVLGEYLTFALFLDFFATIIAVICYNVADALLMREKLGGPESEKHWPSKKRKLTILRITDYVFFFVFLLIFIIGTAVILCRRG